MGVELACVHSEWDATIAFVFEVSCIFIITMIAVHTVSILEHRLLFNDLWVDLEVRCWSVKDGTSSVINAAVRCFLLVLRIMLLTWQLSRFSPVSQSTCWPLCSPIPLNWKEAKVWHLWILRRWRCPTQWWCHLAVLWSRWASFLNA